MFANTFYKGEFEMKSLKKLLVGLGWAVGAFYALVLITAWL